MPRDVIPFPAARRPARTAAAPDLAFAALPLLRGLSDTLAAAAKFRDACRAAERRANRWAVPPLFFFDPKFRSECDPKSPPRFPDPHGVVVARRMPAAARAWADLADLAADAFTLAADSVEVRRTARAVPHLTDRLADLAPDHRLCRELSALLAVPDDLAIVVIHPAARAGWQVVLRGVADLNQFHVLLADAVTGPPARGFLPGPKPNPKVVAAYQDAAVAADDVATARFQFVCPSGLRADGTLPAGLRGVDHWLWGHESPAAVPAVDGEQVLLLADAAYPRGWPAGRRFPALRGEVRVAEVLSAGQVGDRLAALSGRAVAPAAGRRAA